MKAAALQAHSLDFDAVTGYDPRYFSKQARFVFDDRRFTVAGAGVRSGKSWGGARGFIRRLMADYLRFDKSEDRIYWVIAPTLAMTAIQKRHLRQWFNGPLKWLIDTKRQGRDRSWDSTEQGGGHIHLIGNRIIQFRGCERPETLVGDSVCGVWWTEAARCKYACWPNVRARLANVKGWMIADTSPFGRGWFWQEFINPAKRKPYVGVHEWRTDESPAVDPEEIQAAKESMPPEFYERDFGASWESFKGRIYPAFKRATHFYPSLPFHPTKARLWVDLNTKTETPACCTVALVGGVYRDRAGAVVPRAHVVSEHRWFTGLDYERWANQIADLVRATELKYNVKCTAVIDPSIPNQAKSFLSMRRVNYFGGDNAILDGVFTVGWALTPRTQGGPLLTFDPSCAHTASEFEGYAWKTTAQGVVKDEPDKAALDAHLLDGIRYGAMELWGAAATGRAMR